MLVACQQSLILSNVSADGDEWFWAGAAWVCGSGSAARDRCWDKQGLDTAWGESRELGEAGESFGQSLGALGKVGLGRGWGELRESLGQASGELGKRLGKASGELGERLGRASGELRESFGRAWGEAGESGESWGKLRESLGRASGKLRESLGRGWGEWGKLGKASGELGESFGKASGELGERLGRASGELRESFGRAWGGWGEWGKLGKASGELGKRLGKASGELGEMLGRASGELRESFGRASSGKLRAGERLGKAFREMWGEPWQQLWGRQSATRGPWSATTYHKQEPGTDDKVPSHLFSKHCVQAQKTYDLTRSGNHFREHLTFPWTLAHSHPHVLLRKGSVDWLEFWNKAASEDWGKHPASFKAFFAPCH